MLCLECFGAMFASKIAFPITAVARWLMSAETVLLGIVIITLFLIASMVIKHLARQESTNELTLVVIIASFILFSTIANILYLKTNNNNSAAEENVYLTLLLAASLIIILVWRSMHHLEKARINKKAFFEEFNRFKNLIDNSAHCIAFTNSDGEIIYQNNVFRRLHNLVPGAPNKQKIQEILFHKNSALQVDDILQKTLKDGYYLAKIDDIYIDETGAPMHIIWNLQALENTQNSVELCVIGANINEIRKTQDDLNTSEALFNAIFEMAADAILIGNPDGKIIKANKKAEFITGFPRSELVGQKIEVLFDTEDIESPPWQYDLLNKGQAILNFGHLRQKDGTQIPIEMNTCRLPQGSYNAIIRDISERKIFEEKLRESETRYRSLFEKANDAILLLDNDVVVDANLKAQELFGLAKEELIGCTVAQISPEYQKNELLSDTLTEEYLQRAYLESIRFEWLHKTPNNQLIDCIVNLSPIKIQEKTYIQAIISDITEILRNRKIIADSDKKLQQQNEKLQVTNSQLREAVIKAEESDRLKSSFLANMSHEIRTPLNGILGFTDILKQGNLQQSEIQTYLDIIEKSGNHLLNLINDIIDLSKIEAKLMELHPEPFCLDDLMHEIVTHHSLTANKKNIYLRIKSLNSHKIVVNADKTKIRQIIVNLLSNAIKFTEKGGVELEYSLTNGLVCIKVSDTGIGIAEENIHKIFLRFQQIENKLGKTTSGTGLGLAIFKSLVELMNGQIMVESTLGQGSTFQVILPLQEVKEYTANTPIGIKTRTKPDLTNKKILVAEDETSNMQLIQHILSNYGGTVIPAQNGKEALELLQKESPFDIVFLDIKMPEISGIEAVVQMRKMHANLPIIAFTAYAMTNEIQEFLKIGFDDVVIKPIDNEKLASVLLKFVPQQTS